MPSRTTRVTAFALVRRGDGRWLLMRHHRTGVVAWEPPGGHVEAGESLEACAARETREETGVVVEIGELVAICVHESQEQRQRRLICFFDAVPEPTSSPPATPSDPRILDVAWVDLAALPRSAVSALIHPLLDAEAAGWPVVPLTYRAEHTTHGDGTAGPRIVPAG